MLHVLLLLKEQCCCCFAIMLLILNCSCVSCCDTFLFLAVLSNVEKFLVLLLYIAIYCNAISFLLGIRNH